MAKRKCLSIKEKEFNPSESGLRRQETFLAVFLSFLDRTRGHETTPLRVKEDIEDVSSELGNVGYRLHFLDETSRTLLLSSS
ncbi:hypothetical protein TNCV_4634471 [Trichonephila clavipes]|nr:hypothetical protein TNCV_4634471 [Trichonephila clavipes]